MTDFKPHPGSFLPFLEYSQRHQTSSHFAAGSPLALLQILFRQTPRSLPLFDLQNRGGMDPSRYAEALRSLLNTGCITFEGDAREQSVHLTTRGAEVVRLSRPA
jgi:predicted transcriptional regulator